MYEYRIFSTQTLILECTRLGHNYRVPVTKCTFSSGCVTQSGDCKVVYFSHNFVGPSFLILLDSDHMHSMYYS